MPDEKFLILTPKAFRTWLNKQTISPIIKCMQMHPISILGLRLFFYELQH